MSELTKEKIYKNELIKAGGEGKNNLERIRSLSGGGDGLFIVHLTSGETDWLLQDKTNAEILQAVQTNGVVCCIYENDYGYNNALIVGGNYDEKGGYTFYFIRNELVDSVDFHDNHFYSYGGM